MQRRATEVSSRRKELQHKRTSLADERTALARDNQLRRRVHDFAARIHAVIDTLDDTQKQQLLRLLIEDVRVTGWHVQIRLRIALDPPPPDPPHPTGPTGKPPPHPRPVSTQDGLRSVGDDDGGVVQEPVEDADGGGLLGQESAPLLEGPVRADGQGSAFVGAGDEPEQQLGAGVVERGEAEFVEDDQVDAQQGFDDLADGVVGQAAVEGFDEVGGGEVADLVPGVDRGDPEPDQGVGLAGARRAR